MGKEKLGVRLCTKRKHGKYGKKRKIYLYGNLLKKLLDGHLTLLKLNRRYAT